MELRKYLNFLWRRLPIILITVIVTVSVAAAGTRYITPVYEASTVLRIALFAGGSMEYTDYMAADRLMNTYIEIATSRPVADELVATLKLPKPPILEAEIIPNTELIRITVEDTNAARAATTANTLADILITQSSQIYIGGGLRLTEVLAEQLTQSQADVQKTQNEYEKLLAQTPPAPEKAEVTRQILSIKQTNYATLLSQYEQARFRERIQSSMITVWEKAAVPVKPSKPNMLLNYILGAVAGLAAGLGLAVVFENLDTTLYTTEDIEDAVKLITLGRIPKTGKRQLKNAMGNYSPFSEAFYNLATIIDQRNGIDHSQILLVMSAQPNQGKSTIVVNLAIALAGFGKRVLVIDCDTRIARMHHLFDLPNECGLKDVLEQQASLEEAIQQSTYERVRVLTSGSALAHPSQLFGSPQMGRLLAELKQQYDFILLDSPAFLAAADVTALTPNADGLLLVVRRSHARREALSAVSRFVDRLEGKPVYLVVNHAEREKGYGYYRYRKSLGALAERSESIANGYRKQNMPESGALPKQQGVHILHK